MELTEIESEISVDPDGVTDPPGNSYFALWAGVLAVFGLFAIVAPFFIVFCIASFVCGIIVLGLARRSELAPLSRGVATISILASLFSGFTGAAYQITSDQILHTKATEVATSYMLALANGDRTTAIRLAGLPQMVEDNELNTDQTSREQRAVRNFLADPVIQKVIEIGLDARWKATGLKAKYREGAAFDFVIEFIDTQATNPRPFNVVVRLLPPTQYSPEKRNQWFVESLNQAPL